MMNLNPTIQPHQIAVDPILSFFAYDHLPAALQNVSAPFHHLAAHVVGSIPRNAERTVALRKLLEAKDAAVRANVGAAGVASGSGPTFFDRLILERSDLKGRLDKLSNFLRDNPDAVDETNREMLVLQKGRMTEYLAILDARIENITHQSARETMADINSGSLRQPPMEGLEDGTAVRELGDADPVRDGPIKFGD